MKEIAVLLIVLAINACLADDSICIGEKENAHLPYPYDCNQFYVCHDKKATLQFCRDQLHFTTDGHYCEDPVLAKCVATPTGSTGTGPTPTTPKPTPKPTPQPSSCVGQKLGKLIRHPDCNKYYVCMSGPVERPCPKGLHFNAQKEVCDWPERANCQ